MSRKDPLQTDRTEESRICHECGRPAVLGYANGLDLCLDCNLKFQQASELIIDGLERQENKLLDEMQDIFGLSRSGARYPERKPIIMSGTFNNIRIDRSNVGVVNTGSIHSVEVSLTGLQQAGDSALASALKEMTEAVINSSELQASQKNDAVQMLETIASEANKPAGQRRSAAMRAVLTGFSEIVKVGAALSTLWSRLGPTISDAF